MPDPRAENCRGFAVDGNGLITGVELVYVKQPLARFALAGVSLIDEAHAAGNTVATCRVFGQEGLPLSDTVYLAWPFPALGGEGSPLPPGNQNNQHVIVNGYQPPNVGPLALYVGDANGQPVSDIIGGLGLPFNRHVSYLVTFRERGGDDGGGGGDPGDLGETNELLRELIAAVRGLAAHLGAAV